MLRNDQGLASATMHNTTLNHSKLANAMFVRALALLAVTLSAVTALPAQTVSPASVTQLVPAGGSGRIHGVVFDSLRMEVVADALVRIPAIAASVKTDARGVFEFDKLAPGAQTLMFSSPKFDSAGLGEMSANVLVQERGITEARLATPSFKRIWRSLCAEGISSPNISSTNISKTNKKPTAVDSGIVWGTVRDAATDTRLSGAAATFRWYDVHVNDVIKKLWFSEIVRPFRTDSLGNYYACGLPTDIAITSQAAGALSASGEVEHVIGMRRVTRMDFSVSGDMVLQMEQSPNSAEDSSRISQVRGTSILRGVVRDDKGKPVPDATVFFATSDTAVRTNRDGEFTLATLPAGTHVVQARFIGFQPATVSIDLKPGGVTEATLQLFSGQALAVFNVKADRLANRDRLGFEERRRAGFGYAIQGDFSNRYSVVSILGELPRRARDAHALVRTPWDRGDGSIMDRYEVNPCEDAVYLDGIPSSRSALLVYNPKDVRAVERYSSMHVPAGFSSFGDCGVTLVWTKYSRW